MARSGARLCVFDSLRPTNGGGFIQSALAIFRAAAIAMVLSASFGVSLLAQVSPGIDSGTSSTSNVSADGSPATSFPIPVRLGSVDSILGGLHLQVPLGPRLPGRIPAGFSWIFHSQGRAQVGDWVDFFGACPGRGGDFIPIIWAPKGRSVLKDKDISRTVTVFGDPWTFGAASTVAASRAGQIPDPAHIRQLMIERGVDDGHADAMAYYLTMKANPALIIPAEPVLQFAVYVSPDGTRYLVDTWWTFQVTYKLSNGTFTDETAYRSMVFFGPNVLWTKSNLYSNNDFVSTLANKWGDRVSITQHGSMFTIGDTVTIKNEIEPDQQIVLTVTSADPLPPPPNGPPTGYWPLGVAGGITVSNTLDLPTTTLDGWFGMGGDKTGFIPKTITHKAASKLTCAGESTTTTFHWDHDSLNNPLGKLLSIDHPSGMSESFTYGAMRDASSTCWDEHGFNVFGGSGGNPSWPAVESIKTTDGDGKGTFVSITRQLPSMFSPVLTSNNLHTTTILAYANPEGTGQVRGTRLTHLSWGNWTAPTDEQAYLFATSAIGKMERFAGTVQSLPYQTILFDGWEFKNWTNPNGALRTSYSGVDAISVMPTVSMVALRTRVYTDGLPTRTTLAGFQASSRDAYGPTQTDEYTGAPEAPPSWTGSSSVTLARALTLPTAKLHRNVTIQRHWDSSKLALQKDSDHKTLDGSALPTLRSVAAGASVDFGTTSVIQLDPDSGMPLIIQGQRGDFTATENRAYDPSLPILVTKIMKSLTQGGATIPPAPGQTSVEVGKEYQYDQTHFRWITGERDLTDGRWTKYDPDAIGRIKTTTNPDGVVVETSYNGWGRAYEASRKAIQANGQTAIGTVLTRTEWDPNGRWKKETAIAEGRTLITTTEFDAFGRVVKITLPDLSTQQISYDGWGQKVAQTPILKSGQSSWGKMTWSYDERGRLMESRDRVTDSDSGRLLSKVLHQPSWDSVKAENTTVTGILTTVKDAEGYSRTTVMDLLGQRQAIVDQAGQITWFTYDKDGHLSQTGQGKQIRTYTYNDMGWLTSRTEPEEGTTLFSGFTMLGTPTRSELNGRITTTSLNAWLMPQSVTSTGPEGAVTRAFTYEDASHRVTEMDETQANGVLVETYGYDALGRPITKSISDGAETFTINQTLDSIGSVTSLSYPTAGGRSQQTVFYGLDDLGRPKNATLSDGTILGKMDLGSASGTGFTDILTFDNGSSTETTSDKGLLQKVVHKVKSGLTNNMETTQFGWSAGGLLVRRGPGDPEAATDPALTDVYHYDALQRLSSAKTFGVYGESVYQEFSYDRYGNRKGNSFTYAGATGAIQPEELRSWTAVYSDSAPNRLPLTVQSPASGTFQTGAEYDEVGRLTAVLAIPNDQTSMTRWSYDPGGRITQETVKGATTRFLLDGQGLRFKRMMADGAIEYTVYGFSREPLSIFRKETPAAPQTMAKASMKSLASTSSRTLAASPLPVVDPNGDLPAMQILQPVGPLTAAPGELVTFTGAVEGMTGARWDFGDGTGSAGTLARHAYAVPGTYMATLSATAGTQRWTATCAITVSSGPRIQIYAASLPAINPGQSTRLSWTMAGTCNSIYLSGVGEVSGSYLDVSPTTTTTYLLTATGPAGASTASLTVGVSAKPVISSFRARVLEVRPGTAVNLSWAITGATSASLDNGIGSVATTGMTAVTPTSTTTYTLSASNGAGTTLSKVTVKVVSVPPIISGFGATPTTTASGQVCTLQWNVDGAASLSLDWGTGTSLNVAGDRILISPGVTRTFTLTAKNMFGTSQANVTVAVNASPLAWKKSVIYGFGQVIREETPLGVHYMQSDHLGSPSIISDVAGTVIGRSKSLPFGERMSGWGDQSLRRYTNHEDQAGSAIYMQARTYLPAYGKFAQIDPVYDQTKSDPETWNLYNYVTNNPVTRTDPTGMQPYTLIVNGVTQFRRATCVNMESGAISYDGGYAGWGANYSFISSGGIIGTSNTVLLTPIDFNSSSNQISQIQETSDGAGTIGAIFDSTVTLRNEDTGEAHTFNNVKFTQTNVTIGFNYSDTFGFIGAGAYIIQHSLNPGQCLGLSGKGLKYYANWYGNGSTKILGLSQGLNLLGEGAGAAGAIYTGIQYVNGDISGLRAVGDAGFGLIGLVPGAAPLSIIYFLGMYAWEHSPSEPYGNLSNQKNHIYANGKPFERCY